MHRAPRVWITPGLAAAARTNTGVRLKAEHAIPILGMLETLGVVKRLAALPGSAPGSYAWVHACHASDRVVYEHASLTTAHRFLMHLLSGPTPVSDFSTRMGGKAVQKPKGIAPHSTIERLVALFSRPGVGVVKIERRVMKYGRKRRTTVIVKLTPKGRRVVQAQREAARGENPTYTEDMRRLVTGLPRLPGGATAAQAQSLPYQAEWAARYRLLEAQAKYVTPENPQGDVKEMTDRSGLALWEVERIKRGGPFKHLTPQEMLARAEALQRVDAGVAATLKRYATARLEGRVIPPAPSKHGTKRRNPSA